MFIKGTIHQEEFTILNRIYTKHLVSLRKKNLVARKPELNPKTVIVGDFNTHTSQ